MAKAKINRKATSRKKKKSWFSIVSPKSFGSVELGESLSQDAKSLIDKKFVMNLGTIVKNMKKQNINVSFVVNETKEDKAYTEVFGYKLEPSFVKRMARKGKSKMDNTFTLKTKDNVSVILKMVFITKGKVTRGVRTSVYNTSKDYLESSVKKQSFEKLFDDLLSQNFQIGMKKEISKAVYPLAGVIAREFKKK